MSTGDPSLPELVFDAISSGQTFADTHVTLTRDVVSRYAEAVHNDVLAKQAKMAAGTALTDPSLLVISGITRRVLGKDFRCPPGGILARQDFEAYRLPRLGERITTRASIENTYQKRQRNYVHLRCDLVDEAGEPVGRVDSHVIWAR